MVSWRFQYLLASVGLLALTNATALPEFSTGLAGLQQCTPCQAFNITKNDDDDEEDPATVAGRKNRRYRKRTSFVSGYALKLYESTPEDHALGDSTKPMTFDLKHKTPTTFSVGDAFGGTTVMVGSNSSVFLSHVDNVFYEDVTQMGALGIISEALKKDAFKFGDAPVAVVYDSIVKPRSSNDAARKNRRKQIVDVLEKQFPSVEITETVKLAQGTNDGQNTQFDKTSSGKLVVQWNKWAQTSPPGNEMSVFAETQRVVWQTWTSHGEMCCMPNIAM